MHFTNAVDTTKVIDELVSELKSLAEVIEEHGDYDPQFGVGAALDRAWAIIDKYKPQNIES